jgi:hypothetical protein
MKKVLLIVSLLASQHLAIAGCSYPMNWTMNITNSTDHDNLSLSCSTVELKPGETFPYTGSSGNGCGTSPASGPSCTYTDKETGQSGTIKLSFDSCTKVSTTPVASINPTAFTCNATSAETGGGRTVCDGVDGISYKSYTATSSFIIINKGPSYQLDWKGIKTNLIQGQAMADKLMSHLKAADSYPPTSITTATYNQATSTLTLRVETPTNNPC